MREETWHAALSTPRGEEALLRRNAIMERFGLSLTREACARLLERRARVLRETERVEVGEGILPPLAAALCDSPYAHPASWEETLGELMEQFYFFKGACGERLSDDELLAAMVRLFNGYAGGSTERLADLDGQALLRFARGEAGWDDAL